MFILTMQTKCTKTNNPSEFQTVGNLPFSITPCLLNYLTFLKNQWECSMPAMSCFYLSEVQGVAMMF